MALRRGLSWLVLARALLFDARCNSSSMCDGHCVIKAERVTPAGRIPFNNSQPLVTAVGCMETLEITFGNHELYGAPQVIMMLKADRSSSITASTVLDDSDDGEKNRICCREHPIDRDKVLAAAVAERPGLLNEKCVSDQALVNTPFDLFQCMLQHPSEKNVTAGTLLVRIQFIVPERADMLQDEVEVFNAMHGTNGFILEAEYPDQSTDGGTIKSLPYRINLQVQRCSACLQRGEGLNALAKRYGTHWTQVYSANHDIVGSPAELDEARLLRLGSLYSVREKDTMMSIALKFGVSVNQLLMWNGYLRNAVSLSLSCLPPRPHSPSSVTNTQICTPANSWIPCRRVPTACLVLSPSDRSGQPLMRTKRTQAQDCTRSNAPVDARAHARNTAHVGPSKLPRDVLSLHCS